MLKKTNIVLAMFLAAVLAAALGGCANDKPMPAATVGTFVDDSYLTTAVKSKLAVDEGLKSFNIKVITEKQVVTLIGTLPTEALRDQAITVAKSVGGVKDVISQIEVKSP